MCRTRPVLTPFPALVGTWPLWDRFKKTRWLAAMGARVREREARVSQHQGSTARSLAGPRSPEG
jgi:hypothetical protein